MKICTVVWNPKSNIQFVGGQNLTIPLPIFTQFPPNALSIARSEYHSFEPCGRIVAFGQKLFLGALQSRDCVLVPSNCAYDLRR